MHYLLPRREQQFLRDAVGLAILGPRFHAANPSDPPLPFHRSGLNSSASSPHTAGSRWSWMVLIMMLVLPGIYIGVFVSSTCEVLRDAIEVLESTRGSGREVEHGSKDGRRDRRMLSGTGGKRRRVSLMTCRAAHQRLLPTAITLKALA